ncbi:hypothetical protein BJ875DRAFT_481402 [Amylocarpus encephaloides]|uniref:Uncharacterized protein n=1 Tax=Amylocarpus encephaloides TaxID=45428 RepID=A0A9P7YQG1_9HELO|nr:hypothetical protein BJ875DRAFT_481402 [Amylocarpus encephaloides]
MLTSYLFISILAVVGVRDTFDNTCNENNCYRAFNGAAVAPSAKSFCSRFTTATTLTTNNFPTYATEHISSSLSSSILSSISSGGLSTTSPTLSLISSTTTLQTSIITTSPPSIYGPGCNADNCLRAFDRDHGQAFYSGFVDNVSAAFPAYTSQCSAGNISSEISSACSCLNYSSDVSLAASSGTPLSFIAPTITSNTTPTRTSSTSSESESRVAFIR